MRTPDIVQRNILSAVQTAVSDTRVVVILGARQAGKSTLLEQFITAEGSARKILTLDQQAVRTAAERDPAGFVAELEVPVAIDEVQRVPELMTEIKLRVDRDKSPGQFVVTGSANLLEMKRVKESLAGRAEYIRLHPFSQGELTRVRETFLNLLAEGKFPDVSDAPVGRRAHSELLVTGGYPEAQHRTATRRHRFFESYIEGVLEKDLAAIGDFAEPAAIRRLLRAIGSTSATELNVERLSNSIGTPASTIRRQIDVLETLFLVDRFPAWTGSLLARAIKRPKAYISDTGLLAYLVSANARRLETDLNVGGIFYETFVAMELRRQTSWMDNRPELFHFRDRHGREVDLVAEFNDGSVVAIEVKATATINRRDMHGLSYLRDKIGDRFRGGALIYTGADTVPFGDRLAAVPLSGLWSGR